MNTHDDSLFAPTQAARKLSRHFGRRVTVDCGVVNFNGRERYTEPLKPSFKIVVILTGQTRLQIGDDRPLQIVGPAVLVLLTKTATPRLQSFAPDETYRYALIDIDEDIVTTEIGIEPSALFDMNAFGAGYATREADKTIQAVAAQILACPVEQPHYLYRLSKAFELAALAIAAVRPRAEADVRGRLSTGDIDRVHSARDLLVASMTDPPDVRELARKAGLNVRKLNLGFRMIFGASPYAFLQEHRLQTAYRMLSSGEKTVSETAHAVGYGAPHLATLFARRFGMPPSELISLSSLSSSGGCFEQK